MSVVRPLDGLEIEDDEYHENHDEPKEARRRQRRHRPTSCMCPRSAEAPRRDSRKDDRSAAAQQDAYRSIRRVNGRLRSFTADEERCGWSNDEADEAKKHAIHIRWCTASTDRLIPPSGTSGTLAHATPHPSQRESVITSRRTKCPAPTPSPPSAASSTRLVATYSAPTDAAAAKPILPMIGAPSQKSTVE